MGASGIKDSYQLVDHTTTSTEKSEPTTTEELPIAIPFRKGEAIYPGFQKVFYVACVLFFGTLVVAFVDVGRKLLRDRRERLSGRRPYRKVDPIM